MNLVVTLNPLNQFSQKKKKNCKIMFLLVERNTTQKKKPKNKEDIFYTSSNLRIGPKLSFISLGPRPYT